MSKIHTSFLMLLCTALIALGTTQTHEGDFILQLSPILDGRKVKPINVSLSINSTYEH
jgi:hypothetical protein